MITTDRKRIAHGLKKRGWDSHYIARTLAILKKSEKKRLVVDSVLFWVMLVLILLGNMIILVSVLPVMIQMPLWVVIVVLSVIGLCFGFLIDSVIRDINLTAGHYLLAGFIIPLIATINMFFVINIADFVARKIGVIIRINPLLVVALYILFFSSPHIIYKLKSSVAL